MSNKKYSPDESLKCYREAWHSTEFNDDVYAEDIEFYAPMKVFKGKKQVVSALKNFFLMIHTVLEYSVINDNSQATMLSKIFLNNSGGDHYLLWEYDYFKFNSDGQIKLYRPIFDSGNATYELLGFDIAARCAEARKLADQN